MCIRDRIPTIRTSLRSKFTRSKNTAQTRSAIRSQTVVELEKKLAAEIIDSYGEVTVTASDEDPTEMCIRDRFSTSATRYSPARPSRPSSSCTRSPGNTWKAPGSCMAADHSSSLDRAI